MDSSVSEANISDLSAPSSSASAAESRYMRPRDAARYCALSFGYLANLRVAGGGPPYVRVGRKAVIYDVRRLDEWLASLERQSTSAA